MLIFPGGKGESFNSKIALSPKVFTSITNLALEWRQAENGNGIWIRGPVD